MAIKGANSDVVVAEVVNDKTEVINLSKVEETRQEFDLSNSRQKYELEIRQSGVIDQLTSQIDITNTTSIIEFGKEPAQQMAQISDQVLSKYNSTVVDDTSKLVDSLLKVMKQIDIDEIKSLQELSDDRNKKKGIFAKFKESAQEKLNKLVGKYQTIGNEMEQICTQLSVYEQQIKESNKDIAKMYNAAKEEYKQLVATIMAGEQACKEIEEYRDQKQKEFEDTGNPDIQFELQNVNQALTLMEQRTADLRGSEAVALQSIPTFKVQEYTNANLARKVNSAFITTVPAFKSALVNSIIAKQQAIQAQGLSALDEATSVLIRKNAENAVGQLQMSQKLANTSAIKADDIEYAWNTILTGIQQYKDMEKQYSEIRKDEAKRIETANNNYLNSLHDNKAI
jgi:uncharacterized protein YaaN involved in tellurite resistance